MKNLGTIIKKKSYYKLLLGLLLVFVILTMLIFFFLEGTGWGDNGIWIPVSDILPAILASGKIALLLMGIFLFLEWRFDFLSS